MFSKYLKKMIVLGTISLFILSGLIPGINGYVGYEKYLLNENNELINKVISIDSEACCKGYNLLSYENIFNNDIQVTLSIMCDWVIGYDNHGPAKTVFEVYSPCYSYNSVKGVQEGDIFSIRWYLNGELYYNAVNNPVNWNGTGSISSYFKNIYPLGDWYIELYCNGVYLVTGPNFVVIDNDPPKTPSNPNPVNHATNVDINTNLVWIGGDPDAGDIVTYDVYFGSMLPLQKVASNISATSFNPGTLVKGLTYFWSIVAMDNYGASTVGPVWDFTTTNAINDPPNKPSKPTGLTTYGKVGISYTYESMAIDNDSDKIFYLFDWDDGTDSGWEGPFDSGDICQLSHIWETQGSYSVKVKAKDDHDAESVWSDPLPIRMPKTYYCNPIVQLFLRMLERFSFL